MTQGFFIVLASGGSMWLPVDRFVSDGGSSFALLDANGPRTACTANELTAARAIPARCPSVVVGLSAPVVVVVIFFPFLSSGRGI